MVDYNMLLDIIENPITIFGLVWLVGDYVLYRGYRAGFFAQQPRDIGVLGPFTLFFRMRLERELGPSVMAPREE